MEFALLGTVTGQYYALPYFNAAPVLAYAPGEFRQLIACSGRQAPVVPDGRKRFDFNDQVRVFTQEVLLEQRDEFKVIEEPKGQYGVPLSRRQLAFHPPFYVEVWNVMMAVSVQLQRRRSCQISALALASRRIR